MNEAEYVETDYTITVFQIRRNFVGGVDDVKRLRRWHKLDRG